MSKLKLKGRDLKKIGISGGRTIGLAVKTMRDHFPNVSKKDALNILERVHKNPEHYKEDVKLGELAREFESSQPRMPQILQKSSVPYPIFGKEEIDEQAINQMNFAMQLPISVAGALMPDAHLGYGLPIGGVLATENAVIPYGVGVDIGCRMCLSVFDMPTTYLETQRHALRKIIVDNTRFGKAEFEQPVDDEILERPEFKEIKIARSLKDKAYSQLGTSGGGNHFVDIGVLEFPEDDHQLNIKKGIYVAILSHSGSRGLGANIANHYTRVAKEQCMLPKGGAHLAWLDLDSEEGEEYWRAMNLAGDYASACHHQIHRRLSIALGDKPIAMVENHHNFAWKETIGDGHEVIVHRKGATPAKMGETGIIPGSMTSPGYIIRGKGNESSINSASHGAGRVLSRNAAKRTITQQMINDELRSSSVELIGGGLDEAPMAYKNINRVMGFQKDLVDIIGKFYPKLVRMEG